VLSIQRAGDWDPVQPGDPTRSAWDQESPMTGPGHMRSAPHGKVERSCSHHLPCGNIHPVPFEHECRTLTGECAALPAVSGVSSPSSSVPGVSTGTGASSGSGPSNAAGNNSSTASIKVGSALLSVAVGAVGIALGALALA
jgi:hypothetical protein